MGRGRTMGTNRRAIIFSLDALLASLVIMAALLVILHYPPTTTPIKQTSHYATDAVRALNALRLGDLNISWIREGVANGSLDPDQSVLEQIGAYWATNQTVQAQNLTDLLLDSLLPEELGYSFSIGGDTLANRSLADFHQRVTARRMITGIEEGKSLEGSTSTAYLKRIKGKGSYAIAYFGGFLGQGNMTVKIDLPADVNITRVTLQADTIADFSLAINGVSCATLTSDTTLMTVQAWNLSACIGDFQPGENNISFHSLGALADAYIAGGYLKVEYLTDQFQEESVNGTVERYNFPVIDGIINLYDAVTAPGIVTDWYLNLSFWSNYTTFFRIGNQTIFSSPGSSGVQNVVLEGHNVSWAPGTIPLRLGTTNFTNVTMVTAGQPADTMLVTDVSGSMDDCGEEYTGLICRYFCRWWWFVGYWKECPYPGSCNNEECGACDPGYSDDSYSTYTGTICNRTKLEIAQAADKKAVDIILNVSGNEVGLVSYNSQVDSSLGLTTDANSLKTEIDSYVANGGTCICCGINKAKDTLLSSTDKRFMIVMSDGDANYKCDNFNDYYGTYDTTNAPQSTIDAGQNACAHNITVFTIGFGSGMSAQGRSTLQQTACNTSLYYDALNETDLEEIYANISNQILLIANFTAQTLVINGTYVASHLFNGTLDLNYTALVSPPEQNEILVKLETPQFANCSTTLTIPNGLRVTDAVVTSYSGPYWTSYLSVNGNQVYNLSDYSTDYVTVGDPFRLAIPTAFLQTGTNNITLRIADNNQNSTNCSANNTIFYSGLINSSVPRSTVLEEAEGCNWNIQFEDGHFLNVTIPSTYSGPNNCSYTNASISYNPLDAYDYGVYHLLAQLDFDKDGRVFVNIDAADLEIIVTVVSSVPYLWGPSIARLEVWR